MWTAKANDVVLVAAVRTAIGNFGGTLAGMSAAQLGAVTLSAALERAKLDVADVDEVILGQVLTAANGQNAARQSVMLAGLGHRVPAITINRVCGSGLQSVVYGAQAIATGTSAVVLAGGQESMSQSAHAMRLRDGVKMGEAKLVDTMIVDGLWDVFNNVHMGITAENVAAQYGISRAAQDEFAMNSQTKAKAAIEAGRFGDEIVPVSIPQKKGDAVVFVQDEFPRLSPLDVMAKLKPAFKPDGTVTAANASGINDGAAVVALMTRAEADKRGLPVLAAVASYAVAGVDPALMGTGPIPASQKALDAVGWRVADLDVIEANEAFAAQALAVGQGLGLPAEKTNVNGGAIALGHPIGASGCRVLVTLVHEMRKREAKRGLATLCIGGGMGIAMTLAR